MYMYVYIYIYMAGDDGEQTWRRGRKEALPKK